MLEVLDKWMSKEDIFILNKRFFIGDFELKILKCEKKEKRDKKKFYIFGKYNVFNYIGGKIFLKMFFISNLGNR